MAFMIGDDTRLRLGADLPSEPGEVYEVSIDKSLQPDGSWHITLSMDLLGTSGVVKVLEAVKIVLRTQQQPQIEGMDFT